MTLGKVEIPFGAQNLIIENGKWAKQANGAVTVTCGGTVVLVTACMARSLRENVDFFPLTVEYQEKTYAAGRIPGGFFKREGRPTEKEILTSRVIDRPLRPLFPNGLYNEVQIVATVLSSDGENDPDVLAIIGASAALSVSNIPFEGPIAAVRVGMIDGEFVLNPTYKERETATLDFVVAGHKEGIIMIEGECKETPEAKVAEALQFAFDQFAKIVDRQKELAKEVGKPKTQVELIQPNPELVKKIKSQIQNELKAAYKIGDKLKREDALSAIKKSLTEDLTVYESYAQGKREVTAGDIARLFDEIEYDEVRRLVFEEKKRADGRGLQDLREVSCEVNVLPRTHGSSVFVRGQTQSLGIVTLGTRNDEQMVESLEGTDYKTFMLHYNFPSFSVGETKPMRGPGRREIGHGALACKALKGILPSKDVFPYTVRIVSEILESNGSSSMASVCSGTLAMMDAGVPILDMVAGVSIGLVTKDDSHAVLITDIMGLEDHFGDMDFKVAGTRGGVTAIQLDLKIKKITVAMLIKAMEQSREARLVILDTMKATIAEPRKEISQFAPRIITLKVNPEKIGEIIGPGGKMIKRIIEESGVNSIDIEDDGKVLVAAPDTTTADRAVAMIKGLSEEPEIGKTYKAKVKRIMNFGAFCEIMPGKEGLVHVSELAQDYVKDINQHVKLGDEFNVKVIGIDEMHRVNLSKKKADQ